MATNTKQTVRELMLSRYGLGRLGTNTGTSATALTADDRFGAARGAEGLKPGDWVMITSGDGAPAEEFSRLKSLPTFTAGTMDLDPALSVALANGDTFEILRWPLSFDAGQGEFSIHEALTDTLANYALFERRLVPITSVTDGDMLASGVTDWAATNATPSKQAASFPHALRALRVVSVSANGHARTGNMAVEEGVSYYLEVTGWITATADAVETGTLILRDVTNGLNITLDNTVINRFEPETLVNTVQIPSGCEQVELQLQADANTDSIEWANVIFRKNSAKEFTIQDRPVPIGYLGKLFAATTDKWAERGDTMIEIRGKPTQMGAGIWQYHTPQSHGGQSLWYEEFVQQAELTSDTSTTSIIKDHLAAIATEKLLFPLQGQSDEWRARYLKATRDAANFLMNLYEQQRSVVQAQRVYTLPRV